MESSGLQTDLDFRMIGLNNAADQSVLLFINLKNDNVLFSKLNLIYLCQNRSDNPVINKITLIR